MKYTGESARRIRQLRLENPLMNLVDIGAELGVSKQYVHKILKKADLHTGVPKKKKIYRCVVCHEAILKKAKLCSGQCRFKYYRIQVACSFCHVDFYLKRSVVTQRHREGYKYIYCSRNCRNRGVRDGYK